MLRVEIRVPHSTSDCALQLDIPATSSQATSCERSAGALQALAAAEFDADQLGKTGDAVRDKCRSNLGVALQVRGEKLAGQQQLPCCDEHMCIQGPR